MEDGNNKDSKVANDHKGSEISSMGDKRNSEDIKMDVTALMNLLDKNGNSNNIKQTTNSRKKSQIKKKSLNLSIPKESQNIDIKNDKSKKDIQEKNHYKQVVISQISQEEKLEKLRNSSVPSKNGSTIDNSLSNKRIIPISNKKSRDVSKSSLSRIVIFAIFLILMTISFIGVVYFIDEKTKTWNNTNVESLSKSDSMKKEKDYKIIVPTKQLKTEEEKRLLKIISNIN